MNGLGLAGLGLGLGAGFLDKRSQDAANRANNRRLAEILGQLGQFEGRQRALLDKSEAGLNRAIGVTREGTKKALGGLALQGGQATRDILKSGAESQGRITADLKSRGLANSSVGEAVRQRGTEMIQSQLSRLAAVLGGQRSGLIESGSAREANATAQLARFQGDRAGQELQLLMSKLGVLQGVTDTAGGGVLGALGGGQGIAALLSAFGGK